MQHFTDCHVDPVRRRVSEEERGAAQVRYLAVAGMGCPNCANRVRNGLMATSGVVDVQMDLPSALAKIWYDREATTLDDLVSAVGEAGRNTHHRYLAVPVWTQE